jgi:hypothetical protein
MQHYESGFEEVTLQRFKTLHANGSWKRIMVTIIMPTFKRVHASQVILYDAESFWLKALDHGCHQPALSPTS